MYAILETGGKQYRVAEGDVITVEKLPGEAGDVIEFDKVLLISDGGEVKVGSPYIDGAKISGEIIETGKGKKVIVFKYKSKKDYRRKQGHRQPFTSVEITSLTGKPGARKSAPKAEATDNTEEKQDAQSSAVNMNMKKEELIAVANEQGIEVDPKATKAEIIEMIENASK
ncbi:MAG: 50S ribosomal protein L21 [Firmicutes bacterium]|nr:50S ribosomal protein L21 [Bacillota bacterium]